MAAINHAWKNFVGARPGGRLNEEMVPDTIV